MAATLTLVVVALLAVVLLPGFVTSRSLGYSVAQEAGGLADLAFEDPACERVGNEEDQWTCRVEDPSGSGGGASYRVEMRAWSCWDGTLTESRGNSEDEFPAEIEGCVKLGDNVRPARKLLD